MPAKNFFDTNILIYAVAGNDPRAAKAEQLLASGGIVSVQSLNEFVAVARRKLSMRWKEVNEAIGLFTTLCPDPVPISFDVHKTACAVAERHNYGIYDALQISAALESGCSTLFSEDLQDGQMIRRQLTIKNPFR